MTVRTWFTISALVLVALAVAVGVRVLSPLRAPALLASAGDSRLEGVHAASCWLQRNDSLRCEDPRERVGPARVRLRPTGTLRIVAAYPVQPDGGTIEIRRGERSALRSDWTDELPYQLEPGEYVLNARAEYGERAYVTYRFAFRVAEPR